MRTILRILAPMVASSKIKEKMMERTLPNGI
jgi:hypothetical protein